MKIFGWELRRADPEAEKRSAVLDLILRERMLDISGDGTVTPRGAMGITAVWACVNLISKSVAMLPWAAMIRNGAERAPALDHPLHSVLAVSPNNYQTPMVFRRQAMAHLLLWGNFYAEIQRDRRSGDAIGLYPVHPSEVTVELRDGRKTYMMKGQRFSDDEVFHLLDYTHDGIRGVSPIAQFRATLNMSRLAVEYGENFYRNGAKLAGVLEHPNNLSPDAMARLKQGWTDAYAGASNAGRVAILEEGMSFKPLSMPLDDAEYVATRKLQLGEVARIFGMPLHKLGEMDGAKFNNVEQQQLSYVMDLIQPYATLWEQEANRKLVQPDERGRLYTRLNLGALLRGDFKARMEGYAVMRQWALATINELRALEDMNPIEGGDILFAGGNAQAAGNPGAAAQSREENDNADA